MYLILRLTTKIAVQRYMLKDTIKKNRTPKVFKPNEARKNKLNVSVTSQ